MKTKPTRIIRHVRQLGLIILGLGLTIIFASCGTATIQQYQATAQTTLTWQVQYTNYSQEDKLGRFEEFSSTSLTNRNGQKPEDAVIGPDDKELWWPQIPPKPSLDDIEARKKRAYEKPGKPELLRTVKYYITYEQDGQEITLPTNYAVYRQVAKAYPEKKPLRLTMGINNGSVEKAEPLGE
jgi:hypothetical protein